MTNGFVDLARNPQAEGGARLSAQEAEFIAGRDSFYIASVSASGWPYVQHRGGPPGFLKVLDARTLAFADYSGNRQYLTLANIGVDDRACVFLMDYPNRRRLKLFARVEALPPDALPGLSTPGYRGKPERIFRLTVEAFDWNCPQHITPRFSQAQIGAAVATLRERLAALEAENATLRARLSPAEAIRSA